MLRETFETFCRNYSKKNKSKYQFKFITNFKGTGYQIESLPIDNKEINGKYTNVPDWMADAIDKIIEDRTEQVKRNLRQLLGIQ